MWRWCDGTLQRTSGLLPRFSRGDAAEEAPAIWWNSETPKRRAIALDCETCHGCGGLRGVITGVGGRGINGRARIGCRHGLRGQPSGKRCPECCCDLLVIAGLTNVG